VHGLGIDFSGHPQSLTTKRLLNRKLLQSTAISKYCVAKLLTVRYSLQILESGSNDVEHLQRLLDYASGLILKLGSPARDSIAKAAHESLVKELSATVSSGSKDPEDAFFTTIVKGLRFIFEQLQVRINLILDRSAFCILLNLFPY